ncbi:hypothetical protein [Streptomyces sp. NPDC006739]|uniref:hypothetical protein n=1 Tax=Streptomyces sp. NPDC006739 TaxID=3364763 RepID=UPI0036B0A30E
MPRWPPPEQPSATGSSPAEPSGQVDHGLPCLGRRREGRQGNGCPDGDRGGESGHGGEEQRKAADNDQKATEEGSGGAADALEEAVGARGPAVRGSRIEAGGRRTAAGEKADAAAP